VNDDVFDWQDLPKSVAVFGPGVIGLELGQSLARLGVRVIVLGRGGRLGPITDPVVRDAALKAFSAEFTLDPDAHVSRVERVGDEVEIDYVGPDGVARTERFEYVLAATGREPNLDRLGLETLRLARNKRGVPAFDLETLQVKGTSIYIAGDAGDEVPLLHEAADEGRIAGENAAGHPQPKAGAPIVNRPHAVGEVSFEDQGRARVMLRNRGHLRVYADPATGRFLGAEMAGPDAEHIGHLLAWALQNRMTIAKMLEMPFYHPVVEEGLRTALRDADAKLRAVRPVLVAV